MLGNARLWMSTHDCLMDTETKMSLDNFSPETQFSCRTQLQLNSHPVFSSLVSVLPLLLCFICFVKFEVFYFENKVLRKIFGTKMEEEIEGRNILRVETLHDVPASPDVSRIVRLRRMKYVGHVVLTGEKICRTLMDKFEEKILFERSRRRWENFKIDLKLN